MNDDISESNLRDKIARKLRVVVAEYGESVLVGCSIVSEFACLGSFVAGFHHYYCPTIADAKLIIRLMPELENNLTFKAARLFEDTL